NGQVSLNSMTDVFWVDDDAELDARLGHAGSDRKSFNSSYWPHTASRVSIPDRMRRGRRSHWRPQPSAPTASEQRPQLACTLVRWAASSGHRVFTRHGDGPASRVERNHPPLGREPLRFLRAHGRTCWPDLLIP